MYYQEHMSKLTHGGNNSTLKTEDTHKLLLIYWFFNNSKYHTPAFEYSGVKGEREREAGTAINVAAFTWLSSAS